MIGSLRRSDVVTGLVLAAALIAWVAGPGWWSPIIGVPLVGFAPGYVLLRGAAGSTPDVLVRVALYIGTSLSMSALIGFALSAFAVPLAYRSFASAYVVVIAALIAVQALTTGRVHHDDGNQLQRRSIDRAALIRRSPFVVLPFLACWALLASAPVRTPPSTELYFAPARGQISDLPTTYEQVVPVELRVIAHLGVPATDETLEIHADGRMFDSWRVPSGSTTIDRMVSLDTAQFDSNPIRIEAHLRSSGERDSVVWLNLIEAPAN